MHYFLASLFSLSQKVLFCLLSYTKGVYFCLSWDLIALFTIHQPCQTDSLRVREKLFKTFSSWVHHHTTHSFVSLHFLCVQEELAKQWQIALLKKQFYLGLHCLFTQDTYQKHYGKKYFSVFCIYQWSNMLADLEFNDPINTIKVMSSWSIYLTELFLGRLSPLRG